MLKNFKEKILNLRFKRKFKTYESCLKFCEKHGTGYENILLTNYRYEKFKAHPEKFTLRNDYSHLQNILDIFSSRSSKEINILSIGDGFGETYYFLKSLLNINFNITVLESPEVCKKPNLVEEITFVDDVKKLENKYFDIIFTRGTINFIPNPYSFLESVEQLKSEFLIFTLNMFSKNEDIIMSQYARLSYNGFGEHLSSYGDPYILYAFQSINQKKFIKIFENNYKIYFSEKIKDVSINGDFFNSTHYIFKKN